MNVIIVGASGFGRELLEYVAEAHATSPGVSIKGFLDDDPHKLDAVGPVRGVGIIGDTHGYRIEDEDRFVVSLGDPALRRMLVDRLARRGARFVSIVHPKAQVSPTARLGEGCIVAPFASVGAYARVEAHTLLNLYAAVGHDAAVGSCCVFSPYSVANGGCTIRDGVFFGTHATVTPNTVVGEGCKVAAGAVVYRDVAAGSLATGNPARAFPLADPGPEPVRPGGL